MNVHLTRRYLFSASHRLHSGELSEAENQATYGKCNNPHGHGHNYTLEVTVSGQVNPKTGMVCDLIELDHAVQREVLERFDHENLNAHQEFAAIVPTTENLCRAVFRLLKARLHPRELEYVRVEETENNFFQCFDAGPQAAIA